MMALAMRVRITLLVLTLAAMPVFGAGNEAAIRSGSFQTSDGVRLHYLESGTGAHAIVFIPGWLMPAAVFDAQLKSLGKDFRVLALDPRSQGQSELTTKSHDPMRRTRDILEFLEATGAREFILAGWSLGVLEVLDFVARHPQKGLRGLILIDNSIGEGRPPPARKSDFAAIMSDNARREAYLRKFCADLTRNPPPSPIRQALLTSALRVPGPVAIQLMNQPYPREYWRQTVEQQTVPVLYAVTPRLREQAEALRKKRPGDRATIEIFSTAGHALFVDEAGRFNAAVQKFARSAFGTAPRH